MSLIDWSDPEEMLGLLAEYVRDALTEEHDDRDRVRFLRDLSEAVDGVALRAGLPAEEALARLRDVYESQPEEFARDPVLIHVHDCIDELQRIASGR